MSEALQRYRDAKKQREQDLLLFRSHCKSCVQPKGYCYCGEILPFDPKIEFAILIHPIEQRRRIATGRMAHLSLKGSHLIPGHDYTDSVRVNALIENPKNQCFILFPGPASANLTVLDQNARADLFQKNKKPVLFVIDGTWATARKTMRVSENLKKLPRICFSPEKPSHFRVRKQPKPECVSTLEAIHHTIELLSPALGLDQTRRDHDRLLKTFDWLVEKQIQTYDNSIPKLRRTN
jgi:DTW domain-containing protein YfiP